MGSSGFMLGGNGSEPIAGKGRNTDVPQISTNPNMPIISSQPAIPLIEPEWKYQPPTQIQTRNDQQNYINPFLMQQYYSQNQNFDWTRRRGGV